MLTKTPYDIVKSRYSTEKAKVLEGLKDNNSNASVKKCTSPKYLFLVDKKANKQEIAQAIEQIYEKQGVSVVSVNTINVKQKRRRVRGREGWRAGLKKAIVTLKTGDQIED
jgi:large subunit ribosomal protein L23